MTRSAYSRRRFLSKILQKGLGTSAFIAGTPSLNSIANICETAIAAGTLSQLIATSPKARYYIAQNDEGNCTSCHDNASFDAKKSPHKNSLSVRCVLCANQCLIAPFNRGRCNSRYNDNGILKTLVYGRPITTHVDPIEKKPLYHFYPGSLAYSLATSGCPLRCQFCQNWQISQARPEDYNVSYTPPKQIVDNAKTINAPTIAFTYNEPTVFIEYMTDIARAARSKGLHSVLISCGYMTKEPLNELCDVLDAIKIDLKGFSKEFYQKLSQADLNAVLRSIEQVRKRNRHLELVNLVIPTQNDSDAMLKGLAKWIVTYLGRDVPIHFSRFHPDYKLVNLPPTPIATLDRARAIALSEGIHYAYVGNVPGHPGNNTYCPNCNKVIIERVGFFIKASNLNGNRCKFCNTQIAGVFS
ncbi:MAG: AmmeMemoRadiSam system radical SAM enzyme [Deltaproteobacteria bacterium]|nr:AmmeMemoRadiSam system radical SAM enzyme [Deltaproteobacteria bacterium]